MDVLLSPFKLQLPGGMLFILACGSIVRNAESYASLLDTIGRYNLFCAIAFDAARLQPIFMWPFLIHITEGFIIEGHRVEDVVEAALGTSRRLGRHTGDLQAATATEDAAGGQTGDGVDLSKFEFSSR
ncbi:hypothetical protein HYDPIDRAFT_34471 [Hydnomerulius pinastri MD-312]|uniref:Uncharacterized protein n=1 Tax=Hydnomerulius pinastri MD-312 TaxID=994086 RepID=A0A0C9VKR8_9AGAM|nr:hypothetical protein HYDPIDRAFT_34471 [Hydnomerulius pinastri MD-312]